AERITVADERKRNYEQISVDRNCWIEEFVKQRRTVVEKGFCGLNALKVAVNDRDFRFRQQPMKKNRSARKHPTANNDDGADGWQLRQNFAQSLLVSDQQELLKKRRPQHETFK